VATEILRYAAAISDALILIGSPDPRARDAAAFRDADRSQKSEGLLRDQSAHEPHSRIVSALIPNGKTPGIELGEKVPVLFRRVGQRLFRENRKSGSLQEIKIVSARRKRHREQDDVARGQLWLPTRKIDGVQAVCPRNRTRSRSVDIGDPGDPRFGHSA
jgi:hypothetical protein